VLTAPARLEIFTGFSIGGGGLEDAAGTMDMKEFMGLLNAGGLLDQKLTVREDSVALSRRTAGVCDGVAAGAHPLISLGLILRVIHVSSTRFAEVFGPSLSPQVREARGIFVQVNLDDELFDDGDEANTGARSPCGFAPPLIRFQLDTLRYSVPLFLKRQCDRTPGEQRV
jgi:hypothetical protein